jgi:hypothetical protein
VERDGGLWRAGACGGAWMRFSRGGSSHASSVPSQASHAGKRDGE